MLHSQAAPGPRGPRHRADIPTARIRPRQALCLGGAGLGAALIVYWTLAGVEDRWLLLLPWAALPATLGAARLTCQPTSPASLARARHLVTVSLTIHGLAVVLSVATGWRPGSAVIPGATAFTVVTDTLAALGPTLWPLSLVPAPLLVAAAGWRHPLRTGGNRRPQPGSEAWAASLIQELLADRWLDRHQLADPDPGEAQWSPDRGEGPTWTISRFKLRTGG